MMFKHLQRGVTLFEMLLVLIIISLVTVAAIRYADRQRDEGVADVLAQKLYEYGHAVREYAYDNQEAIEAGELTSDSFTSEDGTQTSWVSDEGYVFDGVDWLKTPQAGNNESGEPYLEESFTFARGLRPLFLGLVDGTAGSSGGGVPDPNDPNASSTNTNNQIIQTKLSWNVDENRPEISVDIGSLYDAAVTPAKAMPDITATAAKKASEYYDPIRGFAAVSYNINLSEANFPQVPMHGGLAHGATESESYLRIDGQNYMKDNINFLDADLHGTVTEDEDNYGMRNLEFIEFDDNDDTDISNLTTLNFNTDSAVNNLNALNFEGTDRKITNLESIDFKTANGRGTGRIRGVDQINFVDHTDTTYDSKTFIKNLEGFQIVKDSNNYEATAARSSSSRSAYSGDKELIKFSEGFCFAAGREVNMNGHAGSTYACDLFYSSDPRGSPYWILRASIRSNDNKNGDYITCKAYCVRLNNIPD